MWCWITGNSEAIHIAILFVGLLGGGYGLYLATLRSRIADRNLLREQYQMGMELLSYRPDRYVSRVAGASILSDILLDSNSYEYDQSILRAFEAYLLVPSVFRRDLGNHNSGDTDYESRETYLVVNALHQYAGKQNVLPMRPLPPECAFTITENTVGPNKDHVHYERWVNARGRSPKYSE